MDRFFLWVAVFVCVFIWTIVSPLYNLGKRFKSYFKGDSYEKYF